MSEAHKLQAMLDSSVWKPTPAENEPVTRLSSWGIMKVKSEAYNNEETFHFVGYTGYEGRVSSKIKSFDKETMSGYTNSGRKYQLAGDSGNNRDAFHVWGIWAQYNGVTEQTYIGLDDISSVVIQG